VGDKAVEQDAAGKRLERAGDELEERGFAAGVGAENGHDFAGTGLEAVGFESEERGLGGIGGVGVADLFDAEADVVGSAGDVAKIWPSRGRLYRGAHASLRRRR
jgi:hypothetical protein